MQTPARTIAERSGELFGQVRGVDYNIANARFGETFQMPFDQTLAADLQQRLRRHVGQRTHALAAPGGEDQRAHAGARIWEFRMRRSRAPTACSSSRANSVSCGYVQATPST